jgi:hypothetical protein
MLLSTCAAHWLDPCLLDRPRGLAPTTTQHWFVVLCTDDRWTWIQSTSYAPSCRLSFSLLLRMGSWESESRWFHGDQSRFGLCSLMDEMHIQIQQLHPGQNLQGPVLCVETGQPFHPQLYAPVAVSFWKMMSKELLYHQYASFHFPSAPLQFAGFSPGPGRFRTAERSE